MTTEEAVKRYRSLLERISAIEHGAALIYYDGVTVAPRDTAANRGQALGILSEMEYELTTGEEMNALLAYLNEHRAELDAVTARSVEMMLREKERIAPIPVDEYVAYQRLVNEATDTWHRAKEEDDFSIFEPALTQIVEMKRRFCAYRDPAKPAYDVLLGDYERGLTMAQCEAFFTKLREKIVPLVRAIGEKQQPDVAWLHGYASEEKQAALSEYVMEAMNIDRGHCGLATTEHPFTTNFASRDDVRITTHYHTDDLTSSLFSVIHEGGHALYELHTAKELMYTGLGSGVSMSIHESQSRFYENLIGRSEGFCAFLFPKLQELFPELCAGHTAGDFHRAVNRAEPSLIRTEADELTYALHIMVRYELEKALINGELTVHELPGRWRELYREYLGIEPQTDREGVLQDSHWSGGDIGYFPSYALGSAYGAQLLARMRESVDVEAAERSGDLSAVSAWLEDRIWKYGCMMEPGELLEKAVGEPFDAKYYTDYLEEKYTKLYEL